MRKTDEAISGLSCVLISRSHCTIILMLQLPGIFWLDFNAFVRHVHSNEIFALAKLRQWAYVETFA